MIDDSDFPSLNRSLLLLEMKQPYVDWANALPDRNELEIDKPLTISEINSEPYTYLIPEIYDDSDFDLVIERMWPMLFELQLSGWTTDDKLWPKKRTRKMFDEWFNLKCSSLVIDLWGKEPLDYSD